MRTPSAPESVVVTPTDAGHDLPHPLERREKMSDSNSDGKSGSPPSNEFSGGPIRSSSGTKKDGPTLRRGAACVTCRKRKVKCDGGKPRCEVCKKNKVECEYAILKPKNRVTALEEKIANLESLLMGQDGASSSGTGLAPAQSSSTWPYPSQSAYHPSNDATPVSFQPSQLSALMEDFQPSFETKDMMEMVQEDFLARKASSSTQNPFNQFLSHQQLQQQLQATVPATFSDFPPYPLSNFLNAASASPPLSLSQSSSATTPPTSSSKSAAPNGAASSASPEIHSNPGLDSKNLGKVTWQQFNNSLLSHSAQERSKQLFDVESAARTYLPSMNGHGLLPDQSLPQDLRDHLIQLFLSRRRQLGGSCIYIPRFISSLSGPPGEVPHASLLYAIYTTSARFSPIPHIRAMERGFLDLAKKHFEDGATTGRKNTSILQVIQAGVILWHFFTSLALYRFGHLFGALTVRLIHTSGMHRINSPVFAKVNQDRHHLSPKTAPQQMPTIASLKMRFADMVPEVKDPVDLWERIETFYMAFCLDRVSSVCNGSPTLIDWNIVQTPLPVPVQLFETNSVTDSHRTTLYQFQRGKGYINPEENLSAVLIKAFLIFHKASILYDPINLLSLRDQLFDSTDGSVDRNSSSVPPEIQQLRSFLNNFIASIPPAFCNPLVEVSGGIPRLERCVDVCGTDQGSWCGSDRATVGIHPGVITLHTVIYATLQLLYSEDLWPSCSQGQALAAAKQTVFLVNSIAQYDFGELDFLVASTFTMTARTLLKEAQRLLNLGLDISLVEIETEVMLLALKRMGSIFDIGNSQATFLEHMVDFAALNVNDSEKN